MKKLKTKRIIIPPINVIAKFIGVPNLEDWKGDCYGIASGIVKDEVIDDNCRAVYGHYLGPISSKSLFRDRRGMPFVHHGWIFLSNGNIVDPTRWVFEAKEPYIALIDKDDDVAEEYDEGGNGWMKANENPPPKYRKGDRQFPFVVSDDDGGPYILDLLGEKRGVVKEICLDQIFWLANLSLDTLGIYAEVVYTYIKNMGQSVFIPIDNKLKILGE